MELKGYCKVTKFRRTVQACSGEESEEREEGR